MIGLPMRRELVILSLPDPLGLWARAQIEQVAVQSGLRVRTTLVDRFDTIEPLPTDCDLRLLVTQHPSAALLAYARERGLPAVIILSSATMAVASICALHGTGFMQALRACSASCALLADWLSFPDLRVISCPTGQELARVALAALATRIGFNAGDLGMAGGESLTIAEMMTAESGVNPYSFGVQNERARWHMEIALAPMVHRLTGGTESGLCWPYDLLLSGDKPDTPASAVIDVTGPARALYYGPYLHLPRGFWRMDAILGFSHDIFDMRFLLEVYGEKLLANGCIQSHGSGLFRAALTFEVTEPAYPIEIRLSNQGGAIEGRMALAQLDLHPIIDGCASGTS